MRATGRSADGATGDHKKSFGAVELSAEQKRPVTQMLLQEYPVKQICEVWSSARRCYYQWKALTDEVAWQKGIGEAFAQVLLPRANQQSD